MRTFLTGFLGVLAATVITGCISVDYVGSTFPETEKVAVFDSKKEVKQPYEDMGVATATASERYTRVEVENRMLEEARENGADAIIVESYEKIRVAEARGDQLRNQDSSSWGVGADTHKDVSNMRKRLDETPSALSTEKPDSGRKPVFRIRMQARFIKFKN